MERRLTAILAADVVGYSRLMEQDEAGTLAALKSHRTGLIDPLIAEHNGRVVKLMGDGALVEFASVVDAVACAIAVQSGMAERNAGLSEQHRIEFRIGVHLGDVIVEDDDLYGDGVNVAARLEGLAEPSGICLSQQAYDQVETKLVLQVDDLGEQQVKNIARPVRAYRVLQKGLSPGPRRSTRRGISSSRWVGAAAMAVLIVAGGVAAWWRPWAPDVDRASPDRMAFPLPEKPSIAVLPFDNLSGDPEQEYFIDGFTENIIAELSRDRALFVIARHSTYVYKGKPVAIAQVAEQLGVRYVVDGNIQRDPERLRVSVQLVDAANGALVWTERYDLSDAELFVVQDEIVRRIVATLRGYKGPIQKAELQRSFAKSPGNLSAYENLMRGMIHKERFIREDNEIARHYFEKAIEHDANFAPAYGWLAWTYFFDVYMGWGADPAASLEQTFTTARRSVQLDPDLDFAHWALGAAYLASGKHSQALAAFERALELNPNNSDVLANTAWPYAFRGEPERAIENIKLAMRLNPHHPDWYWWGLGIAYFTAGRYEDAVHAFERMTQQNSETLAYLISSYAALGDSKAAEAGKQELISLEPDFSLARFEATLTFEHQDVPQKLLSGLESVGLPKELSTSP